MAPISGKSKHLQPPSGGSSPSFWGWLRPYRGRYAFGLASLLVVDALNVGLPLILKEAIDALPAGDYPRVVAMALAYSGVMCLVAGGRYLWRVYLMGSSHLVARDLRRRLFGHLLGVGPAHRQELRSGDLMSRATNDVESMRMAMGPGVLVAVDAALLFLLIVPVMWSLSPRLTLFAFAFFPLVPVTTAWFGKRIDRLFEVQQGAMSRLSAYAQENFAAARLVKSLVLETSAVRSFRTFSETYLRQGCRLARLEAPFAPLLAVYTYLGTALILWFGGKEVLAGTITLGTFVAFQRYVVQLAWPMEAIGWAVTLGREGRAAHRRLAEVFSLEQVESSTPAPTAPPPVPLLWIRRLEFAYPGAPFRLDLKDLRVEAGERVGVVGPVGSGKSTLLSLLLRLYEPVPGSVFWNGQDVRNVPLRELRTAVACVEQQVVLFSDSVRENVRMGLAEPLPGSDVERLARQTGIAEELAALPQGQESRLGERGITLSGGQKQRIALMRALARRPSLLLLDDALSAVDVAVEHHILRSLLEQFPGMAMLVASHRLSIVPHLDRIWVMAEGRVADQGTHGELLKRSAWYRSLWDRQSTSEPPTPEVQW